MNQEQVTVADGKYTIINDNGKLTALRNGEPWGRDLVGDNLVYWMMVEIQSLTSILDAKCKEIEDLKSLLKQQRDLVEKCMVEMNANADKGEIAEAELARLKAQPATQQPAGEPVAECVDDGEGGVFYRTLASSPHIGVLYTTPQPAFTDSDQQLATFYNAKTYPDLVRQMEHHIHKLQVKLNQALPGEKIAVTPVRAA